MGLELQRSIGIGGAEEVCPLENFGKAELVEGNDDRTHRLLAADDEDFDGFALTPKGRSLTIGVGVAVKFEGEFEVNWARRFGVENAGTVASGGGLVLHSLVNH